jgi:DNA-nicking Smr family endonuclease
MFKELNTFMNKYEQAPEFILDLHGHTTKEAGEVLDMLCKERTYRHVRVITGKGDLRNGPVLRSFVESYFKKRGVAFRAAKLNNGGQGALEVFLFK